MHWFWRATIGTAAGFGIWSIAAPLFSGILNRTMPGRIFGPLALWIMLFVALLTHAIAASVSVLLRSPAPTPETRCRKCGYILRGITDPRCPECGERTESLVPL
jgi:hypothetical protein